MQKAQKLFQVKTPIQRNKSNHNNEAIHEQNQKKINYSISKFERLQPEIMFQITNFLVFHQYLELRLLSHLMKRRISTISILKQQSIKQKIEYKLFQFQLINNQESYQQQEAEFQNKVKCIKQLANNLNKFYLLEVRAYNKPPQLVIQILSYLMILLNFKNHKQNNWEKVKEFLLKPFDIVLQLEQIIIHKINQSQLENITPILEISVQQVYNISYASGVICDIIQQVIKIRNSKFCQLLIDQENIQREIKICHNQQKFLDQISFLSKN